MIGLGDRDPAIGPFISARAAARHNAVGAAFAHGGPISRLWTRLYATSQPRRPYFLGWFRWLQSWRGKPLVDVRGGLELPDLPEQHFLLRTMFELGELCFQ